jgi:integrase
LNRRGGGEGTFHTRPNGLIAHSISLGYDTEGRRIRPKVYGRTKAECRNKMAAEIEAIRRRGGVSLPDGTTVTDWAHAWLARKKPDIAPATYLQYHGAVVNHIEPRLGRFRLDRLAVRDVDAWLTGLARDGVGSRARQYARMVLGNMLRDAMRLEMLDRNVVSLVKAPVHRKGDFPIWDITQAMAFLSAAKDCRYSAFWTLWLTTGPRPHELLGLRPQDVVGDELTIQKQLRKGGDTRERLKTESSRRVLKLAPVAVEALRAHREALLADGLRASPWLFPRSKDAPLEPTVYRTLVRDHFEIIVARAGVPRIRPYDLRHTYATLALKAGVPIKVVSEALGHASIELTLRTYVHVLASMRDEHVDMIQQLSGSHGGPSVSPVAVKSSVSE